MFQVEKISISATFNYANNKSVGIAIGQYKDNIVFAIASEVSADIYDIKLIKELLQNIENIFIWDSTKLLQHATKNNLYDLSLLSYQLLNIKNPNLYEIVKGFDNAQFNKILRRVKYEHLVPATLLKQRLLNEAKANLKLGSKLNSVLKDDDIKCYNHLLKAKSLLQQIKRNAIYIDKPYLAEYYETCEKKNKKTATQLIKHLDANSLINPEFCLTSTITGRLSCKGPINFHSLPNNQGIKRCIKSRFEKGCILIADWNAMELRLALAITGESAMHVIDLHEETAKKVFKDQPITAKEREQAKIINFAAIYGSSNNKYISIVKQLYPQLITKIDIFTKKIKQVKRFKNIFGRRRLFRNEESYATKAFNNFVQSTAADINLKALYLIQDKFDEEQLKSKIILTVHDSIVIDCTQSEAKRITNILNDIMTDKAIPTNYKQNVHFPISLYVGRNYEDITKLTTIYKDESH